MKIKYFVSVWIIGTLVLLAGSYGLESFLQTRSEEKVSAAIEEATLDLHVRDDVYIRFAGGFEFEEIGHDKEKKLNATDETYTYHMTRETDEATRELTGKEYEDMGKLQVVLRTVDNGDQFVFTRFENEWDWGFEIPYYIVFKNQSEYELFAYKERVERKHDNVFGIDYTSNVKGVYTIGEDDYEMILSQNFVSYEQKWRYSNGKESVLREYVKENATGDVEIGAGELAFELTLNTNVKRQISESWFMLTNEQFFNTKEEMQSYKDYTNHHYVRSQKWLTAEGNYSKLPWAIEPYTQVGYGRNLVNQQGTYFVDQYPLTKDRFYYNMIVADTNYLIDMNPEQNDLWYTEYTSTWLKKNYGIVAPYTDTRHNENIAQFLVKAGDILNNAELKNKYTIYADFLTKQEAANNVFKTENGYYILDYFAPEQSAKTHASFNHILAEMNFLLESYALSKNEVYLNTALAINSAIQDTGREWINPKTGDFWYQLNPGNDGTYTFKDTDYPYLTLEDMLYSLELFKALQVEYDVQLYTDLVTSKVNFIKKNEIEITRTVVEDLQAQGFGALIDRYKHVVDVAS
ncbi:MAG: hypothetical protein UHX00_11635 [Caryophanon sp.]|nr:hypothetical protein [Caryophanon sp.]